MDQKQPIRLLRTLLHKKTIPHAFLFTGMEGVGKRTTAAIFAMACNCTGNKDEHFLEGGKVPGENNHFKKNKPIQKNDPCGHCRSCRKILSGNHPDIIRIEPSGPFIRIAQIRALYHILSMKPYEARRRVVIISEAQAMNPEAGNALLKILEEPPDQTTLILTAIQTSDLLPTIVSRCHHIRFRPIPPKSIESILIEKQGFAPDAAKILGKMANGSFSKALSMKQSNWVNRRNWLMHCLESFPSMQISSLLAFAEKLSRNKETLSESLELIQSWLRDLIVYRYDSEKIINNDLAENIRQASHSFTVQSLLSKMDAVQTAQKNIQGNTNLNVKLIMEILVMRLADRLC
ncbi:MAG TPA: DNA polymerase III subunit delta' [Desulfobacterales bacterium]|nr:DNA polymerase III subunit delta' [Desulfobacterales bacterium]